MFKVQSVQWFCFRQHFPIVAGGAWFLASINVIDEDVNAKILAFCAVQDGY